MWIQVSRINKTAGYRFGDDTWEEGPDNVAQLFLVCQREFGRCMGKVYHDRMDGGAQQIGWVFERREEYTDVRETYIQETWVVLHDEQPTATRTYHYHHL